MHCPPKIGGIHCPKIGVTGGGAYTVPSISVLAEKHALILTWLEQAYTVPIFGRCIKGIYTVHWPQNRSSRGKAYIVPNISVPTEKHSLFLTWLEQAYTLPKIRRCRKAFMVYCTLSPKLEEAKRHG
jgi:hypothetical protein